MRDLPSGTITFLFTDVEGSTRLLHELGAEGYAEALAEHRRLIRQACAEHGGVEVDTQGDAFFFAFPNAPGALEAARAMTEALASGPIQVRVGLHTGTPLLTGEGYVGDDVHFAARVAAAGHGGQIIVSAATATRMEPSYKLLQGVELTDLGEHRLKDIAEPVSIFQLGAGSFPPLKTISNTNLPRPASSFVGREQELHEVLARIRDGARLLTLSGPGGTGKTRLAIEAASTLVPAYKAGVFWVGLASLRDPALVTETISQTLGAKNGLAEHIGERELLLLLDNLEQVVESAPALSALVQACPNLTLLCTSRELLRVHGEVEYPVPPLAEPEAVALFCERAQVEPSEEIAELCARLDNLPLAVELAAARTKALSPAQILERLSQRLDLLKGGRDADPRQQTLRATIEWSYDLLSPEEQQLFARLSVFAGGCTLEAAQEVAGADLDTLQSLVEKSLLRFSNERYWMLETIREYAGERLAATANEDRLRPAHAKWFLDLTEHVIGVPGPKSRSGEDGFEDFEDEYDNVRGALAWFWRNGADESALRLGSACFRFWLNRAFFSEAASWLEAAGPKLPRATARVELHALKVAALIAQFVLARDDEAEGYWMRSLRVAEELDQLDETAWIESKRAGVIWARGDIDLALALFERGLKHYRATGNRAGEAESLKYLGEAFRDLERFNEAERALLDADTLYRDLGKDVARAFNTHSRADLALDRGDLEAALSLYSEALDEPAFRRSPRDTVYCLAGIASVLAESGSNDVAAALWGAVWSTENELGFRMLPHERRRYEARLAYLEHTSAWTEGCRLTLEEARDLAGSP